MKHQIQSSASWQWHKVAMLLVFVFISTYGFSETILPANNQPFALETANVDGIAKDSIKKDAQPDMPAQFPGGERALISFIAKNVVYPEVAFKNDIQGTVIVRFLVKKDGKPSNFSVVKSLSKECDAEALRVAKLLPRFTPARKDGKAVPTYFNFPIRFILR